VWLLRGVVPTPGALFGALSRAGRLRQQVKLNRGNITARRDLATIYLDVLRPRRALELLEEGLALSPDDPELLYLAGLSLHRVGRHEEALGRLLRALEKDQRLRHGQPYFAAGQTLLSLGRWDDAADAFERYLDFNGSDVAAHTSLARAYAGGGDASATEKWLLEGLRTWHGLSGALKRRQLGAFLRAEWARVTLLKQPIAIAIALGSTVVAAYGVGAGYPLVARWFAPSESAQVRVRQAMKQCGSQRTGDFEGQYEIVGDVADEPGQDAGVSALRIRADRVEIPQGAEVSLEYCLSKVLSRKPGSLHAEAVVRFPHVEGPLELSGEGSEDIARSLLYDVRLDRGSTHTRLRLAPLSDPLAAMTFDLRRKD
jgi:tetratricopeptide (TPR) repeat protein